VALTLGQENYLPKLEFLGMKLRRC